MNKLVFSDEAKEDLLEIQRWYDQKGESLFENFLESLDECLFRVTRLPLTGEQLFVNICRKFLKAYLYFILYRINPDFLFILGVLHHKRDSQITKDRFSLN